MNLLNYLGPAKNELDLALVDAKYETLEKYMKEREGEEMTVHERIAYHLGRMNLVAEIVQQLKIENPEWEEEE